MHAEELIRTLSIGLSVSAANIRAVGLDLVHLPRIRESLQGFGERFESRMFTQAEATYARSGTPEQRIERLAARFAAKEATIKALDLSNAGIDWRDIEVVRAEDGTCSLALHGQAAAALHSRGASRALVCLSHDGEYAAAVVAVLSDM